MRAASAVLLAGIFAVSGSITHAVFRYGFRSAFRRDLGSCHMCYADECVELDEARCTYYEVVDEIMDKPETDGVATKADNMMFDLMRPVNSPWTDTFDCVPLLSLHTDCTKENICEGCKTCTCDSAGRWRCREEQKCQADASPTINYHKLMMVIETLSESDKLPRAKRSVKNVTDKYLENKVSLMDIAEWMYAVKPNNVTTDPYPWDENDNKITKSVHKTTDTVSTKSKLVDPTEMEYLDFEELLKNIAFEDRHYKRRKPQLKENNDPYDYKGLEDVKITNTNARNDFIDVLNNFVEDKYTTESEKEATFVVNLLPNKNDNLGNKATEDTEINNIIFKDDKFDVNHPSYNKNGDIMKRDVSSLTNLYYTTQATSNNSHTTQVIETTIGRENDLYNGILIPLTNIIDEKEAEIKELLVIRDNLLNYMKVFNNTTANNETYSEALNGSKTYFSIYKLDLFPEIHENLRRTNSDMVEKLLYKLKRDIYEVLRDISRIQKLSKTRGLPDDLKMLIRSMKYYIHKQGSIRNFRKKGITLEKYSTKDSRRLRIKSTGSEIYVPIKSQLIKILELISKNNPKSDSLLDLSPPIKKIIRRVVNQNNFNEFFVYDAEYNFTNDLAQIGKYWPLCTTNLENAKPQDTMYAMKLFHLILSRDINKINDAIYFMQFALSRRMIPTESSVTKDIMEKVYDNLITVTNKVLGLINYRAVHTSYTIKNEVYPKNKIKKVSFLKKLKNLLKNSKSELLNMVRQKIPKHDIVKRISIKKMNALTQNEISEHKHTMEKWQKKLNIGHREKRHLELEKKKHYRGIIPKYLRGKIHPALLKTIKSKIRSALSTPASKRRTTRKLKTHKASTVSSAAKKERSKTNNFASNTAKKGVHSRRQPKPSSTRKAH